MRLGAEATASRDLLPALQSLELKSPWASATCLCTPHSTGTGSSRGRAAWRSSLLLPLHHTRLSGHPEVKLLCLIFLSPWWFYLSSLGPNTHDWTLWYHGPPKNLFSSKRKIKDHEEEQRDEVEAKCEYGVARGSCKVGCTWRSQHIKQTYKLPVHFLLLWQNTWSHVI